MSQVLWFAKRVAQGKKKGILGLCTFMAEDPGSVLGGGTKIPQAMKHGQKKEKEKSLTLGFLKHFY